MYSNKFLKTNSEWPLCRVSSQGTRQKFTMPSVLSGHSAKADFAECPDLALGEISVCRVPDRGTRQSQRHLVFHGARTRVRTHTHNTRTAAASRPRRVHVLASEAAQAPDADARLSPDAGSPPQQRRPRGPARPRRRLPAPAPPPHLGRHQRRLSTPGGRARGPARGSRRRLPAPAAASPGFVYVTVNCIFCLIYLSP